MVEDDVNEEEGESEEGEDEEDGEGESEGSSVKKILMIVLPIVLLLAIGGGLYFSGFLDKYIGAEEEIVEEDVYNPAEAIGDPIFVKIEDILVSLNSPANKPKYLRLSVHLELKRPEDQEVVEKLMPRIIDKIRGYLSELRVQDIRGSMGMARLRTELKARVNLAIRPVEVKNVLFQKILIQ